MLNQLLLQSVQPDSVTKNREVSLDLSLKLSIQGISRKQFFGFFYLFYKKQSSNASQSFSAFPSSHLILINNEEYLIVSFTKLRRILHTLILKLLLLTNKFVNDSRGDVEQSVSQLHFSFFQLSISLFIYKLSIYGRYFLRAIFIFPSSFNTTFSKPSSSSISGFSSINLKSTYPISFILSSLYPIPLKSFSCFSIIKFCLQFQKQNSLALVREHVNVVWWKIGRNRMDCKCGFFCQSYLRVFCHFLSLISESEKSTILIKERLSSQTSQIGPSIGCVEDEREGELRQAPIFRSTLKNMNIYDKYKSDQQNLYIIKEHYQTLFKWTNYNMINVKTQVKKLQYLWSANRIILIETIIKSRDMFYQWQSRVLNKLYKTQKFNKLVHLKLKSVQDIDYFQFVNLVHDQEPSNQYQSIVQCANVLIQEKISAKTLQEKVKELNSCIQKMPSQNYSVWHVIMYSCLSKCRIWPKVLKSGKGFVPQLIKFYNNFTDQYNDELDFKFDPLILTKKYTNIMKKVKSKKKDHPELVQAVENSDIQSLEAICRHIYEKIRQQNESQLGIEEKVVNYLQNIEHNSKHIAHLACESSSVEIVLILWKKGLNFEVLDMEQQTPLFYAVKRGNIQILQLLVQTINVSINHREYMDRTPIYLAAFQGNLEVVKYLYHSGANPLIPSKLYRTPLSKACYLGNIRVVQYFVQIGVQLEQKDNKGRTALHNAVWGIEGGREGKRRGVIKLQDSPESAKILLEAGHDVDLADNDGFTPLFSAVSSCAVRSVRLLREYKANFEHKTIKNETVCFIAAKYGHLQILKILVEQYSCDFMEGDKNEYSPLAAAITLDEDKVFKYLSDKYVERNENLRIEMLLECKLAYADKRDNMRYLLQWIDENRKVHIQHIYKEWDEKGFEILLRQEQFPSLNMVLVMIIQQEYRVDEQFLRKYVDKCTQMFKRGSFGGYIQFMQLLMKRQLWIQVQGLEINGRMSQKQIIRLLGWNSNLTKDAVTLRETVVKVVQNRMTEVILFLIQDQGKGKTGIFRFSKQEINGVLKENEYGSLNLIDFCSINAINDIGFLLDNKGHNCHIPKYQYRQEQKETKEIVLNAVDLNIVNSEYVLDYLSHQQRHTYTHDYKPSKSYFMVRTPEDLCAMTKHIYNNNIVGIDVEHYHTKLQSFVCCLQISACSRVYILDPFSLTSQSISDLILNILNSPKLIKVFHSYENDLKWLDEDFGISRVQLNNVVDTSKLYCQTIKKQTSISLKNLCKMHLSYEMKKDYQRADWRIRPLFRQMIEYAAIDAQVLPFLYLRLISCLNAKDGIRLERKVLKGRGFSNILQVKRMDYMI